LDEIVPVLASTFPPQTRSIARQEWRRMRTSFFQTAGSAVAVVSMLLSGAAFAADGWQSDFATARATAETSSVPILLHFYAWYCGPCQRMERDVFPDATVQAALVTGLVAVKVDTAQDPELAAQFGASTVPRDVVVYPDGTTKTVNIGYLSRSAYLGMLSGIVGEAGKYKPSRPEPVIAQGEPAASSESAGDTATAASHEPVILGLDGFCPVKLRKSREWVAGTEGVETEYRGIQYRFVSVKERDEFLKAPSLYAPQDLGCDPVVLTDSQRAVSGDIRFGAFFDDRLYLFESAENREAFRKSPLKFSRVRSALRATDIQTTSLQ
jgi:thiol-disulfide isomerase/thioredoxin/YHS domain-containing protein